MILRFLRTNSILRLRRKIDFTVFAENLFYSYDGGTTILWFLRKKIDFIVMVGEHDFMVLAEKHDFLVYREKSIL